AELPGADANPVFGSEDAGDQKRALLEGRAKAVEEVGSASSGRFADESDFKPQADQASAEGCRGGALVFADAQNGFQGGGWNGQTTQQQAVADGRRPAGLTVGLAGEGTANAVKGGRKWKSSKQL